MAYNLIGKNFVPPDVEAKVTGRAKYAEDFRADNMVFVKMLTSPIAHGKIRRLDTSAALKMKGVLAIMTADDVPEYPPPQQPILAKDEVFYVGEPILAVAAESELIAANAIEAIRMEFTELPHVTDPLESLLPGGPNARSDGNVAASQINLQTLKWDAKAFAEAGDTKLPMGKAAQEWTVGDLDAGFKASKLVIEESFTSATYAHHSLETRTAFSYWQNGKCYLFGSNQSHTSAVPNIARLLGIKPEDLVFVAEYCGGGFGSRIPGYPSMAIPALMSKKLSRPVMHRITRLEEYSIGSARPAFQGYVKLGFREDGKMLAADMYIVQENGPTIGAGDFRAAAGAMSLVYTPAAMRWRAVPVLTNTPPVGAMRGPGENQFTTSVEPMMDKAAKQLGIDRVAIRLINAPTIDSKFGADEGPVTSSYMKEAMTKAATIFGWDQRKLKSGKKDGTKVTGIGIGQGYHSAGSNGFDGLLRITPDGVLHIHTGVGNLGTYSHSATARVAAELLNYNWDNTVVERGDSRRGLPWNSFQAGSLTASTQSRTMYVAAMDMRDKLTDIAAQVLGGAAADYDVGAEKVVSKTDPSKSLTFAAAAKKAIELGGKYAGKEVPKDINPITKDAVSMIAGTGLIGVAKDNLPRVGTTPGLVAAMAEVEIDTETGHVEIKEVLSVADCGTVLHPQGLHHALAGGASMGIGMAHFERHVYDPKLGIPAAASLEQSKLPTYLDYPVTYTADWVDLPDKQNPMGVKGVGEPALGSAASAVNSAIVDAMGGVLFNRTPVSLDMILNQLEKQPQAHKPLQINTV